MANITWNATKAGLWNTGGNWVGGLVPGVADAAFINNAFSLTVTYNVASSTIDALTIGGSGSHVLAIGANTLNVTNAVSLTSNSTITLAGGTLSASTITNDGKINGSGTVTGDVSGTGSFSISAAGTMNLSNDDDVDGLTFTFAGATGTLNFGTANSISTTGAQITGMQVGTGKNVATTVIDFSGHDVISASFDAGTDVLTITDAGGAFISLKTNDLGAGTFANWDTTTDTVFLTDTVCYAAGTLITTENGDVAIEDIRQGDNVVVLDGDTTAVLPVKWVGIRQVDLASHKDRDQVAPVRIAKDAFAENVPNADLVVSPPHAIFVDGSLIPAKMLVNDMTITRETARADVTYYHIELDRHAIVMANGLAAESYLDTGNRSFFRNAPVTAVGNTAYHVNDASQIWEENACAPLTIAPNDVRPTWAALADRAESLGFSRPTIETTTDADLHIELNGRRIEAAQVANRTYRFVLPTGADAARLVSRATAPSVLAAYTGDQRRLGVSIRSISVKAGANVEVFTADHPALNDGWHTTERLGAAMWRWSNGNAALPVAGNTMPVILEIQLADTATYAVREATTTDLRIAA